MCKFTCVLSSQKSTKDKAPLVGPVRKTYASDLDAMILCKKSTVMLACYWERATCILLTVPMLVLLIFSIFQGFLLSNLLNTSVGLSILFVSPLQSYPIFTVRCRFSSPSNGQALVSRCRSASSEQNLWLEVRKVRGGRSAVHKVPSRSSKWRFHLQVPGRSSVLEFRSSHSVVFAFSNELIACIETYIKIIRMVASLNTSHL